MQEKDVGISKGDINMEEKIVKVLNVMSEYLSIAQMKKLQEVILQTFAENEAEKAEIANDKFLEMFLDAKTIEGCSERTIKYYRETVQHLLSQTETSVRKITTEEIREYLSDYQKLNNCSNVTIDNVRIQKIYNCQISLFITIISKLLYSLIRNHAFYNCFGLYLLKLLIFLIV